MHIGYENIPKYFNPSSLNFSYNINMRSGEFHTSGGYKPNSFIIGIYEIGFVQF